MSRAASGGLAGAGLIVLAATCFATLGPLTRVAAGAGVQSLPLVTWRAAIGATVVLGWLALRGWGPARIGRAGTGWRPLSSIPRPEQWRLAGAALASAVLNLAVFIAFVRLSIALALLIFYLYPAFVALASAVWFGERLDRLRWGALLLALVGLALVLAGGGTLGHLDALGIGLALLAALSQMGYVLLARHGFASLGGPQAAGLTMGLAALINVGMAVVTGSLAAFITPLSSPTALWPVILAGTLGAGLPTTAFIVGVRLLGAPRAAVLAMLEPVAGIALAALLLGERPTPMQLLGGALVILAGVVLQIDRPTRAVHEAAASGQGT